MNNYILKACRSCGGDLARDGEDWICLQCGRYSYVGLYSQPESPVDSLLPLSANSGPSLVGTDSQRAGRGGGKKTVASFPAQRLALSGALP